MRARTLEEWTASWRRDCLRGGLTDWHDRCSDKEVVRWLITWINKFDKPRMQNLLPVVDTREDWLQLRNQHYGGEDIPKMCDVSNKWRLAQHILCALIYEHEISVITDSDQLVANGAYARLTRHVFALRTTPAYKVACKPTSQTLDWYSVARYFSTAIAHGPTRDIINVPSQPSPAAVRDAGMGGDGDAYGRYVFLRAKEAKEKRTNKTMMKTEANSRRLETQNVRGFIGPSRMKWLRAWRRTPVREQPIAWMIQETHVSSPREVVQLSEAWTRLWGRQHVRNGPQLSYWSASETKKGGVAILLNPTVASAATAWQEEHWTPRVMALTIGDLLVVNVYAPNIKRDRETFFADIHHWLTPTKDVILTGDFNSVQSPLLDRLGGQRSDQPESVALAALTDHLGLEDARTLEVRADDEDEDPEPASFYTYWGPEAASRIDRFYVPRIWTARVQWVIVEEPPEASDHQRVRLNFTDSLTESRRRPGTRVVTYPIRTAHPGSVQAGLLEELRTEGIGRDTTPETWDAMVKQCVKSITSVARRERKRRKTRKHRIKAQARAHLLTRKDLLRANAVDQREEALMRQGRRLERTLEQLRWSFKRVSNWEKDQTISAIRCIHGKPFTREMSTATKFSTEWGPILGEVHNTVAPAELMARLDAFVRIPAARKISDQ